MRSFNHGEIMLEEELQKRYHWPDLVARRTESQPEIPFVRGMGMGGSSAINGLISIRALPEDLDEWAAQGCTGWSHADVLPTLRRLECDLDFGDRPIHGNAGPNPIYRFPIAMWGSVDRALRELGTQQLEGLACMLVALDLQGQETHQGRVRIVDQRIGKLVEGVDRHRARPVVVLYETRCRADQYQAIDPARLIERGLQCDLTTQRPAQPPGTLGCNGKHQPRPLAEIGVGCGRTAAVTGQLDHG